MGIDEELLKICPVCKRIKTGDKHVIWLERKDNFHLYDRLVEVYKGKISHKYCPEHIKELGEKYNL